MKKVMITVVLLAMFGYAVLDLVKGNESGNSSLNTEEIIDDRENNSTSNQNSSVDVTVGIEVGNLAPDFQLATLNGETIRLSDYRGQPVMLNFWATWCPPCRAEMPDMEKFSQKRDVAIVAVNLTETETSINDVHDFVGKFDLTFPILLDKKKDVATKYQIRPIPTSYMIDSKGVIQYRTFGPLNYEMMVSELEKIK